MMPDGLLESVKKALRITHKYLEEDIENTIIEAMDVIDETCGKSDYSKEGLERKLVKAYCRYARSNVPELFEKNFQADLIKLQIKNGVNRYAKDKRPT